MMKKSYLTLAFTLCFILANFAQGKIKVKGSKNVTTESKKIEKFRKILLDGEYNILLAKGDEPSLTIEADDNIHEFIEGSVNEEGTLVVYSRAKIKSKAALNITITYVDGLEEIETTGTAKITSTETLDFKNITLRITGGSRSHLDIKAETFSIAIGENSYVYLNLEATKSNVELSENSKIEGSMYSSELAFNMLTSSSAKVYGEAVTLTVQADNAADFDGRDLKAQNIKAVSNAKSDMYLHATDNLEIDTSGSSEIYVYSNPKITLHSFLDASVIRKK